MIRLPCASNAYDDIRGVRNNPSYHRFGDYVANKGQCYVKFNQPEFFLKLLVIVIIRRMI